MSNKTTGVDAMNGRTVPEETYATALTAMNAAIDRAEKTEARAEQYERDWYAAKSEFGVAMATMRARVRELEALHEDGDPPVGSRLWRCEQELAKARARVAELEALVEDGNSRLLALTDRNIRVTEERDTAVTRWRGLERAITLEIESARSDTAHEMARRLGALLCGPTPSVGEATASVLERVADPCASEATVILDAAIRICNDVADERRQQIGETRNWTHFDWEASGARRCAKAIEDFRETFEGSTPSEVTNALPAPVSDGVVAWTLSDGSTLLVPKSAPYRFVTEWLPPQSAEPEALADALTKRAEGIRQSIAAVVADARRASGR